MLASPNSHAFKVRPHTVRKAIKDGDRFYVYAWRGGPLAFKRDQLRPTKAEAVEASEPYYRAAVAERLRARPKFIQHLLDNYVGERWTYFIGGRGSAIKIGAASCVKSRMKALQANSPVKLRILAMVRGGETLEGAYHSWFAEHRLHGEWFEPHANILAEIERLQDAPPLPLEQGVNR